MPAVPTERQLNALAKIQESETGKSVFINKADAEECVDLDWAESTSDGYRLTNKGREILTNSN